MFFGVGCGGADAHGDEVRWCGECFTPSPLFRSDHWRVLHFSTHASARAFFSTNYLRERAAPPGASGMRHDMNDKTHFEGHGHGVTCLTCVRVFSSRRHTVGIPQRRLCCYSTANICACVYVCVCGSRFSGLAFKRAIRLYSASTKCSQRDASVPVLICIINVRNFRFVRLFVLLRHPYAIQSLLAGLYVCSCFCATS